MPTIPEIAKQIETDLDAWKAQMRVAGEGIPDFWDEQSTSERLGDWLSACGYQKVDAGMFRRPGDMIAVVRKA